MERPNKVQVSLNIVLLLLFFIIITYLTISLAPSITRLISTPERFRNLIISYDPAGILVFIFFQIFQIIVAIIPGELLQIAGGYIYGTLLGTIYSLIGVLVGSVIAFYISRLLGFRLIKSLIAEQQLEKVNSLINSPKSEITLFLLFIIPGIPKDFLVYIAGCTPIKPLKFFIILSIARFPGLLASAFIGSNIQEKDYHPVIIVATIACILFAIGVLKKDLIVNKIHALFPRKD